MLIHKATFYSIETQAGDSNQCYLRSDSGMMISGG